jgi:hypothetical protein
MQSVCMSAKFGLLMNCIPVYGIILDVKLTCVLQVNVCFQLKMLFLSGWRGQKICKFNKNINQLVMQYSFFRL